MEGRHFANRYPADGGNLPCTFPVMLWDGGPTHQNRPSSSQGMALSEVEILRAIPGYFPCCCDGFPKNLPVAQLLQQLKHDMKPFIQGCLDRGSYMVSCLTHPRPDRVEHHTIEKHLRELQARSATQATHRVSCLISLRL